MVMGFCWKALLHQKMETGKGHIVEKQGKKVMSLSYMAKIV